ncbi:MAG: hypothetical protein GIKADHBN_00557 [Phycisphaerales bacterium]|nr:hypothetical protein [Phycisphaerales bacterium]
MLLLYAVTIFLSAALLFLVQPLAAKLVLPLLGGTPAVWTTCMLFFQALLLGGYLYGHLVDRYLKPRQQVLVHVLVMAAAAASLPLGLPDRAGTLAGLEWNLPTELMLSVWLLVVLGMAVGPPFFVVSTTGPLMQRWFSRTGHTHAKDPYFLYAASNAGSMLGLAAYPFAVEPMMGLKVQGVAWSWAYGVFVVLATACGVAMARRARPEESAAGASPKAEPAAAIRLSWKRMLRWLLLAAVPSSLMLGVTQQISTDVASVPLLWIIPLGLYLLTFIIVFSPRVKLPFGLLGWLVALLVPAVIATMAIGVMTPIMGLIALHFGLFFIASLLCHGLLAADRPPPEHLTTYFLIMAGGGMVGGAFNSLVAPTLFNDIYEYPIALVAVLLLRRPPREGAAPKAKARGERLAWSIPALILVFLVGMALMYEVKDRTADSFIEHVRDFGAWVRVGLPLVIAAIVISRPLVFAASIGVIAASMYFVQPTGLSALIYKERSFFGVIRVLAQYNGAVHLLSHGTTVHGAQIFLDEGLRLMPTTYYHPSGPVGQLFDAMGSDERLKNVAVVGLGTGSIAAYAQPNEKFTFYDIDRSVIGIATGQTTVRKRVPQAGGDAAGQADRIEEVPLFTYLKDAVGNLRVILADGRQGLAANAEDGEYGLIIIDAFSSDAIPVHMLTVEAFEGYFQKLSSDGLLMVHVSNRHFDLTPVVARIAQQLGMSCLLNNDMVVTDQQRRVGKRESRWIIISRGGDAVAPLLSSPNTNWKGIQLHRPFSLWTDDYSNVLEVLY